MRIGEKVKPIPMINDIQLGNKYYFQFWYEYIYIIYISEEWQSLRGTFVGEDKHGKKSILEFALVYVFRAMN